MNFFPVSGGLLGEPEPALKWRIRVSRSGEDMSSLNALAVGPHHRRRSASHAARKTSRCRCFDFRSRERSPGAFL